MLPEDVIRARAYRLWEAAGRPPGDGTEFWLAAEAVVQGTHPTLEWEPTHERTVVLNREQSDHLHRRLGSVWADARPDAGPDDRVEWGQLKLREERHGMSWQEFPAPGSGCGPQPLRQCHTTVTAPGAAFDAMVAVRSDASPHPGRFEVWTPADPGHPVGIVVSPGDRLGHLVKVCKEDEAAHRRALAARKAARKAAPAPELTPEPAPPRVPGHAAARAKELVPPEQWPAFCRFVRDGTTDPAFQSHLRDHAPTREAAGLIIDEQAAVLRAALQEWCPGTEAGAPTSFWRRAARFLRLTR